ncbi:MAG TPA: hypothetical protein VIN08_19290 [Ohtaekwangia sp.]|uniref:hypothetical protein n=1 Tax=Ohtaekwangia sp. TaxID=2066019 RepID=UPI002F93664C
MKISLVFIALLFLFCSADIAKKKDVVCSIELSVVRSKKFGQLISVVGKLENRTNRKLYFDGARYLRIDILKQHGKKFLDFYEGWQTYETINEDREEMAAEIFAFEPRIKIFDESTGQFTDSLAKAFYDERIKDQKLIKSAKDSATLREWTKEEFERIVFLESRQNFTHTTRMNSLPAGSYKIVYSYSNVNNFQNPRLPNLVLPKVLNGFERWTGTVVSDTLHLNVK